MMPSIFDNPERLEELHNRLKRLSRMLAAASISDLEASVEDWFSIDLSKDDDAARDVLATMLEPRTSYRFRTGLLTVGLSEEEIQTVDTVLNIISTASYEYVASAFDLWRSARGEDVKMRECGCLACRAKDNKPCDCPRCTLEQAFGKFDNLAVVEAHTDDAYRCINRERYASGEYQRSQLVGEGNTPEVVKDVFVKLSREYAMDELSDG